MRIGVRVAATRGVARCLSTRASAITAIENDGMKHCELPDGRLMEYADCGPANGQPVLMLPGSGCTGAFYKHAGFEELFEQHGVRVIAPSLADHGLSDPPTATGTDLITSSGHDCVAVMDHAGVSGAFMVTSWSLSSHTALELLAAHPERLRAALLTSPSAPLDVPGTSDDQIKFGNVIATAAGGFMLYMRAGMPLIRRAQTAAPEMKTAAAALLEHHPEEYDHYDDDVSRRALMRTWTPLLEYLRGCMQVKALGEAGLSERLGGVHVPVLTCCDPDEGAAAEVPIAWLLGALPNATRLPMPPSGVGHYHEAVPASMDLKLAALIAAAV